MALIHLMALVGVGVQATLTLMLLVVWRALGARWMWLLAAAFGVITLQYAFVSQGYYNRDSALSLSPATFNSLLPLVAHGLISAALIAYVDVPEPWARRLNLVTASAFGLALLALFGGVLVRAGVFGVIGAFMCSWLVLLGWAVRREPQTGHGIVMLAALIYPGTMVAALAGLLDSVGVGIALIVPHALLGLTILTTGLVRARKAAVSELQARQAVQAELERTNQTLELRVALRTAQLRETIEGLESFNRSVSHDLRGPLGGITGVAQLAREALQKGDLATADKLLGAIARQSQSSSDLVTSLLDLARAGEGVVERRRVHTTALVQEVADLVGGAAAAPDVIVVEGDLPDLEADPALLRQVFANLLANGVKFSAGGARVPRVCVGATRGAEGLVFHVRDNGVGFTEAQRRDLFVPFRRLHADRFEGNGVGLTIVRRIVERHGGRLWAESRPGEGATFYFTLEEARATAAA